VIELSSVAVEEKPTAAYVVSVIGGILGLLVGIVVLFSFVGPFYLATQYGYVPGSFWANYFNFILTIGLVISGWLMIASLAVLAAARSLNNNPMEHTKYGVIILVFGVLGGAAFIFGLIGGILALVYEPIPPRKRPVVLSREPVAREGRFPEPVARFCPECGERVEPDMMFCPKCGARIR
jgi:hypothetical protein